MLITPSNWIIVELKKIFCILIITINKKITNILVYLVYAIKVNLKYYKFKEFKKL